MKIAIIGGGAAGFFAAVNIAELRSDCCIDIYEKSNKVLSKVKISGGGRCNVTNNCASNKDFSRAYPRGSKFMKKVLHAFNKDDCMQWFEDRGVPLVVQEDECVFPRSQSSQSVIDCFMDICIKHQVRIHTSTRVSALIPLDDEVRLLINENSKSYDKVIVATGGYPKRISFQWIKDLGLEIIDPLPSLFTFNMPDESIRDLMGVVVENAMSAVKNLKYKSEGPLLITHWGMSGPAILKLSAFGARQFAEDEYSFKVQVNWLGIQNNEHSFVYLKDTFENFRDKQLGNVIYKGISSRLWQYLLEKYQFDKTRKVKSLSTKEIHQLNNLLTNDSFQVKGKTTFKEEFVTAGGVCLSEIDHRTMAAKKHPNIYFAGEVLDIDGITGGYNFQAAWTTAYIAAQLK